MTEKRENSVQKKYKVGVEAALEVMGEMEAFNHLSFDDRTETDV